MSTKETKQHTVTETGNTPAPGPGTNTFSSIVEGRGAAPPRVDLLRTTVYDLNLERTELVRTALLAAILESTVAASACQLQQIAQFVEITKRDSGCTTPAEDFITSLVADYFREGLTPELATERIESSDGFRANFADAVDLTRRFVEAYPEIIKTAKSALQEDRAE